MSAVGAEPVGAADVATPPGRAGVWFRDGGWGPARIVTAAIRATAPAPVRTTPALDFNGLRHKGAGAPKPAADASKTAATSKSV